MMNGRARVELSKAAQKDFKGLRYDLERPIYHLHQDGTIIVCIVFMVGPHENISRKAGRRYEALLKSMD